MKNKQRGPLFFILLTAVALIAGGGLTYWQWGNVGNLETKVSAIERRLGDAAGLSAKVENSRQEVISAGRDLTHLESGVSTAAYIPTLLQELQKTGESCGLKITGVRPLPPPAPAKKNSDDKTPDRPKRKDYESLDVEVKSAGSFDALMAFFRKLEAFPKIVSLRNVSINPKTKPDGVSLETIESVLNIRVYVFPPTAEPNKPSTEAAPKGAI